MKWLAKLHGLSRVEQRLVLEVGVLLVDIRMALSLLPFRHVRRFVDQASRRRLSIEEHTYRERVVWAATGFGKRLLTKRPCLTQALVVQYLFNRAGYPTQLRIGVAKGKENRLMAHAWLKDDESVIIGGHNPALTYTPLKPFQSAAVKPGKND